jgi:hypothetical protein
MIVAGTGSRSFVPAEHRQVCDDTSTFLTAARKSDPGLRVMSGMAEGWDEFMARVAIDLEIPFIAVLPTSEYGDYYWRKKSVSGTDRWSEFSDLLARAEQVVVVCTSLYVEGVHANFVRNQYMVDQAEQFLVWNPESRGTADCVRRIKKAEKPFRVISDSVA